MNPDLTVTMKTCPRCKHRWLPRVIKPRTCPMCKNELDRPQKHKTKYTKNGYAWIKKSD